jgi:PAS domain S-box-containing protein
VVADAPEASEARDVATDVEAAGAHVEPTSADLEATSADLEVEATSLESAADDVEAGSVEPMPMAQEHARAPGSARDLLQYVARASEAWTAVAQPSHNPPAAVSPIPVTTVPGAPLPAIRSLIDQISLAVLVLRNGEPVVANPALLDLLDYPDEAIFHAEGAVSRMFKGREPEALVPPEGGPAPLITRNGEVVMLDLRIQAVDWEGQPARLITLRRENDLFHRVRSLEMELRQSQGDARELHAILDTATDGVAVLDEDGRILSLNRAGQALFGYDQNEVAGEPFSMLLLRESQDTAQDYLAGLKTNGVATVLNDGREVLGRAHQGGAIPLFMTLGRVGAGGLPKFCAVLRDMTAWKRAEHELKDARRDAERASALKSEFLAKVSHEIRTPLNAILGFAEVIIDERFGPIGNERYKDYLKDIHASGTHVMSLVNDMLDLSKIEAGKMDLASNPVDANRIVSECVSLMQPQANTERVIVRMSLAPRLPNVLADERSLRQIVLNLLSNAVKFNEPGGQVIVSTALTDAGHAVIRIRDTGIGMSDADLETALEPFRQLATSRKVSGTGLGLPLTKALVEANRANFSIKSRKNEGTLVEVAFPPNCVLAG